MNGRKVAKGCGIVVAGWLGLSMCAGVVGTVAGGDASPVASSPVASISMASRFEVRPEGWRDGGATVLFALGVNDCWVN